MICPLKFSTALQEYTYLELPRVSGCEEARCSWWDSKANYNPETKQFEGQCCILTLSSLKISGGINTHPY